jgi:hypothetical protein
MHLNTHELARLDAAVACPFDAGAKGFPLGAQRLFYGCWHALLCEHLPDAQLANVLVDEYGHACRSIWYEGDPDDEDSNAQLPDPTSYFLEGVESHELDQLLVPLEGARTDIAKRRRDKPEARFRDDVGAGEAAVDPMHKPIEPSSYLGTWIDKDFESLTGWLQRLHLATGLTRKKHWPPSNVKTIAQLLDLSRTRSAEGWLHVDANEQQLWESCLAAMASNFSGELERRTMVANMFNEGAVFLTVWNDLFFNGSFRIGIDHQGEMGAAQGMMARRVVYDISPSANEFHCFPVQNYPSVRAVFAESILDF